MTIETIEELAEYIADLAGIYDCCKNVEEKDDNCTYDKFKNPTCCRMGFVQAMGERIREAVKNEEKYNL